MKTSKVQNRRSIRLPEYDYSQPGAYFVTICAQGKQHLLGKISDGELIPSQLGQIAEESWGWLVQTFPSIEIPIFCIMPNHVHAIISITSIGRGVLQNAQGGWQAAPTSGDHTQGETVWSKPLGRIIGAYKTHSTTLINRFQKTPRKTFWQRNYYERVIRNEGELQATYDYIMANPANWKHDEYR